MKTKLFAALVVSALLCHVAQAHHILSSFTLPLSGGNGWSDARSDVPATGGNTLPLWLDGDFDNPAAGSDRGGEKSKWEASSELSLSLAGLLSERNGAEKCNVPGIEDKHNYETAPGGLNYLGTNRNCSPIPEPSTYAVLLGVAAFGLAVRRRRFGVMSKS